MKLCYEMDKQSSVMRCVKNAEWGCVGLGEWDHAPSHTIIID